MTRSLSTAPSLRFVLLLATLALAACDDVSPPVPSAPPPPPDAAPVIDAAPIPDAAPSALPEAAPPIDSAVEAPRTVALGIEFSPSASGEGTAERDAELLSLGVRSVVLHAAWNDYDLDDPASAARWERLAARARLYDAAGARVLLALDLAQRSEPLRPDGLSSWSSAQGRNGVEALIDHAYETLGDTLASLCLGHEVDRYLRLALNPSRGQFRDLLLHGLGYATAHDDRPAGLVVGISIAHDAILQSESDNAVPEVLEILAQSDAIIATYVPLNEAYQALPGDEAIAQLGELQRIVGERPLVLEEVSYPSATEVQSSPSRQASFYRRLFEFLQAGEHSIELLSISPYIDPLADACAAQAATFPGANDTLVSARCSLGLWPAQGPAKPAWSAVLSGLLAFHSP